MNQTAILLGGGKVAPPPPADGAPLRILHVLDHSIPLHSGYAFRTRSILRGQRALGWQTHHVTSAKQGATPQSYELIDGLAFYRSPALARWMARLPLLGQLAVISGLAARLLQVARDVKPDILHAHSPALNAVAALRVGRRLGIPVVYEVRGFWEDAAADHGTSRAWGPRYRLTRGLETWAMRRADAVTTICEGLRADIVGRGIASAKVAVIPNAVDAADLAGTGHGDAGLKARLGLEGRTVLGFIGSFYAYEGLALLLRALPALLVARPEVVLLLVGGGPQEDELKRLAQALGLARQVRFAGRVPHQQVAAYYEAIDVLVYPRLKMRLTDLVTPLKPLEAMAQGRLLVASDVGGHRELIQDGCTGMLFAAGDARALAACVLALLDAPQLWPALRARARLYVEQERSWSGSVGRYRTVYAALDGIGRRA